MKTNQPTRLIHTLLALLILFSVGIAKGQAQTSRSFFDRAHELFSTNVDDKGSVNYEAIKNESALLEELYQEISSFKLEGKSPAFVKAFYTNTYNILVIKQVVDRYPIAGPLTVNGFFDKIEHTVAGESLTLNQVEKDKNLYVTQDERLHFALVCAAVSCPPLANYAFRPETIEKQLEERTALALSNEAFIWTTKKTAQVSQIFSWYKDDFKQAGVKGPLGYINKYRENQIPKNKKIVYYEYNWALNKQ